MKGDCMRINLPTPIVSLGLVTVLVLGFSTAATQGERANRQAAARTPAASLKDPLRDRFVGTWKLVSLEQRNAKGEAIPPAAGNPNRTGYIIYDPAGYMAVSIMPVGRKKYAGPQPTDEEVKGA